MQKIWLIILSTLVFSIAAEESKTDQASDKAIEFYAGISLGWDHLVAKRTEQLVTGRAAGSENLYFSQNKTKIGNGINGKVIFGFLWAIPNTVFVLSPEIYLGQGSSEITIQESVQAPATHNTKELQNTLKQNLVMGFILRTGFYLINCQNNFLYLLLGIDQSKFENKFMLSSSDFFGAPVPTLFEKRSKFLKSPVIGLGFEKKFNKFKIGVDIRYLNYSAWGNYSKKAPVSDDVISIKFKPQIISTALSICYLF